MRRTTASRTSLGSPRDVVPAGSRDTNPGLFVGFDIGETVSDPAGQLEIYRTAALDRWFAKGPT
jgi:hypothetical protein